MSGKDVVTLCAIGDIAAFRQEPESAFEYVSSILRKADIRFAQNERHYSDRRDINSVTGTAKVSSGGGLAELTTVKHAEALKLGGFDVISFASNHSMDLGARTMTETIGVLKKLGFNVIGAGKNLKEARTPAIIERKGIKVAFLAYVSVVKPGEQAGPEKAGVAPMRAYTLYHQLDFHPGTPPKVLTFPYKEDLEAVIEDVKKARTQADVVVLSFHWGIHHQHATIATYQKEVAHAVIEAGADMILGHHPHILKGIEVYKGKPIFYSMGNFALDLGYDVIDEWRKHSSRFADLQELYDWKPDPKWSKYAFPPEARKSMIVRCDIVGKKIQRASFLPILINQKAQPRPIPREDRNFDRLFEYMNEITESQGLKTKYSIEGNEIVVSLA